jgi:vacuolar-type H+-ATPase subunit I/STV1
MHKTSVLKMEEAFMADACDSENQEMQIDKPKTSGSAMASFLWFEALKFSLRVMRKSFFKLFIPAMALSFVMGAFHVLLGFVLAIGFLATCVSNPIIGSIGLVLLVLFHFLSMPFFILY